MKKKTVKPGSLVYVWFNRFSENLLLLTGKANYVFGSHMIQRILKTSPLVSVVVVDHNGSHFWPDLIDGLETQSFKDFEVVLVENGGRVEIGSQQHSFSIRRIVTDTNIGFSQGCNLGWVKSEGEFVAFLNNDTTLGERWLEMLVRRAEESRENAIVASKILFDKRCAFFDVASPTYIPSMVGSGEDRRRLGIRLNLGGYSLLLHLQKNVHFPELVSANYWIWTKEKSEIALFESDDGAYRVEFWAPEQHDGKFVCFATKSGKRTFVKAKGRSNEVVEITAENSESGYLVNSAGCSISENWLVEETGLYELDNGRFDEPRELEAASACSILVRKSSFSGELPFDPAFFAYYEDVDFCRKARARGYRIIYEPKSVVYHKRSGTAGVQSAFQVFHSTRNRFWVIAKHAPWKVVLKSMWGEMRNLDWYAPWLDDEFSLSRLKRETWLGFAKRVWWRLTDAE
ncbi:glycosyltransferase family 2 protein [Pelagicoccus sp. SDUM812003]|uniref:glycosyltransferase family 2 protein n=1 Tax=Pelagicoccus sp. SDUM812003 TaxID=3041267 RepID=UPI00280FADB7|nr:glycosyltransferase family 2 protein [Pelagicoccus sp. SDUM812003]MDQ8204254.1 glycosyltransferase family 2 protein [Pelagicoccus sp. SDUM812003]